MHGFYNGVRILKKWTHTHGFMDGSQWVAFLANGKYILCKQSGDIIDLIDDQYMKPAKFVAQHLWAEL